MDLMAIRLKIGYKDNYSHDQLFYRFLIINENIYLSRRKKLKSGENHSNIY